MTKYKILIPNASGTKNLGDLAIFEGLISSLEKKQEKQQIVIHSFDPKEFHDSGFVVRENLYYWAVFHNKGALTRLQRLLYLLIALILPEPLDLILPKELKTIINDYKKASLVILKGGGYFRSKPGVAQQLNAIMNGISILFAKKYRKHIVIRPMSFGPFSNKVTEWLSAKIINLADEINIRDDVSLKLLSNYISSSKLTRLPDDAFLLKPIDANKHNKRTLGFTVREWIDQSRRGQFLDNMAKLIKQTAKEKNCIEIQPIIQVNAPDYNEGDEKITKDLAMLLKKQGMSVKQTIRPKNVKQSLETYGKLSYLVGMRMHSCIFASIQKVSFTAVAYEHKHDLLEKYNGEIIFLTT